MTKPPTWQELRDAGRVQIDQPDRGLAIYPSVMGNVILGVRTGDGAVCFLPIQLSEFDAVATALAESEARASVAKELLHQQESMVEAYQLIQRVKGSA